MAGSLHLWSLDQRRSVRRLVRISRTVILACAVVGSVSCKRGLPTSATKIAPIDIQLSRLHPDDLALVCQQRILAVYVGAADLLSTPVELNAEAIAQKNATVAELTDYHEKFIKPQGLELDKAFASDESSCADKGLKDGLVQYVKLTDGPEYGDSVFESRLYHYDAQGRWEPEPPESWRICEDGTIATSCPGAAPEPFELNLPATVNPVAEFFALRAQRVLGRPFTQGFYIFKGHGLVAAEDDLPPSEVSLIRLASSVSTVRAKLEEPHVFVIDAVGPKNTRLLSDYYSPHWTEDSACKILSDNGVVSQCRASRVETHDATVEENQEVWGGLGIDDLIIGVADPSTQGDRILTYSPSNNSPFIDWKKFRLSDVVSRDRPSTISVLGSHLAGVSMPSSGDTRSFRNTFRLELPFFESPSLFVFDTCNGRDQENVTSFLKIPNETRSMKATRLYDPFPLKKGAVRYGSLNSRRLSALAFGPPDFVSTQDERVLKAPSVEYLKDLIEREFPFAIRDDENPARYHEKTLVVQGDTCIFSRTKPGNKPVTHNENREISLTDIRVGEPSIEIDESREGDVVSFLDQLGALGVLCSTWSSGGKAVPLQLAIEAWHKLDRSYRHNARTKNKVRIDRLNHDIDALNRVVTQHFGLRLPDSVNALTTRIPDDSTDERRVKLLGKYITIVGSILRARELSQSLVGLKAHIRDKVNNPAIPLPNAFKGTLIGLEYQLQVFEWLANTYSEIEQIESDPWYRKMTYGSAVFDKMPIFVLQRRRNNYDLPIHLPADAAARMSWILELDHLLVRNAKLDDGKRQKEVFDLARETCRFLMDWVLTLEGDEVSLPDPSALVERLEILKKTVADIEAK